MFIETLLEQINVVIWGWPIIIFFITVGLIATVVLGFLQIRYLGTAWKLLFATKETEKVAHAEISPLQSFMNVLSCSIGNGSLAGMATALYSGGPGAAFWVLVIGFFGLIIRFCEVYLSDTDTPGFEGTALGGPMLYLRRVPGGSFLPHIYAIFCLLLVFFMGNAMQTNSIALGLSQMTSFNPLVISAMIGCFIGYIMLGGAERILKASDIIVPFKVGLFFLSSFYVLFYHIHNIIPSLKLIIASAFTPQAVAGGALGYSVLEAIRFGMARSLNATETGLGTAAILFGSAGSKKPVESGLVSMVSAFVSNYFVCFLLMLIIVASGVWNNGQTSTALTISAFQTAFGLWGGWVVTVLSIIFGAGVFVSYAFIGREVWKFLFHGNYLVVYSFIYFLLAIFGSLAKVNVIWQFSDFGVAGLTIINLFGILWLLPEIKRGVVAYQNKK